MNKLTKLWNSIPSDKKWHFGVSFGATIICGFWFGIVYAFLVVLGLGCLKETFDIVIRSTKFSYEDIQADFAGCIAGFIGFAILASIIGFK